MKHDLETSAGCAAMLTDLDRQHEAARSRLGALTKRREDLALEAASGDEQALIDLRALGDEEATLKRSIENIAAAKKAATERHAQAAEREREAEKEQRYESGAGLREELFTCAEEFDVALQVAAEILQRHDRIARELSGLRLLSEGAMTYLAQGAGIEGALLSAGFGPSIPSISRLRTASGPLAQRHREIVGFPSKDYFMKAMP